MRVLISLSMAICVSVSCALAKEATGSSGSVSIDRNSDGQAPVASDDSRTRLLEVRNGWIMSSPPSSILWSVYTEHAKQASNRDEHDKALALTEAALEHVRHLDEHAQKKQETIELIKQHYKANAMEIHWPTLAKVAATPYAQEHPGYLKKDPPRAFEKPSSYTDKIREADLLYQEGENDQAEALYKSALNQLSKLKSTDGMILVKLVDRVTRVYYRDNKFQQAEEIIREHLFRHDSMWDRLGPDDPDRLQIAFLLSDLGLVYTGMNRFNEAEAASLEGLSIVKRFRGEKDPDYIVMLGALARLHKYMGEYEKSRKEYRTAISLAGQSSELSKSSQAIIMGNYHKLLIKMGKSREASKIAVKANSLKAGTVQN